jgi:hypothetical protein
VDLGRQRRERSPFEAGGTAGGDRVTRPDENREVKGLSGNVKDVYSASKATIQFSHFRQERTDLIAFDLTHLSDWLETELSGVLGFAMLRMLDMKIDYRDGLVNFTYDAKRYHQPPI